MHVSHLLAWFEVLWHHAHNGTLPPVPTGTTAVTVPPIDTTKSAPAMGVTVATLPAGVVNTSVAQDGTPVLIPVSEHGADNVPGIASAHGTLNPHPIIGPPVPGTLPVFLHDGPGLVNLDGSFVGETWQNMAYAIAEVRDSYPVDSLEHRFLSKNIDRANIEYRTALGFIGVCFPLGADGELDLSGVGIQGSLALPEVATNNGPGYPTVAKAYAFYGHLAEPVTNDGAGFGPPATRKKK